MYSNKCEFHGKEFIFYCRGCGIILCPLCTQRHKCSNKKKIEGLNDFLLESFKFEKYLGEGTFGKVFKSLKM